MMSCDFHCFAYMYVACILQQSLYLLKDVSCIYTDWWVVFQQCLCTCETLTYGEILELVFFSVGDH